MAKRTPLYAKHVALGGKIVEFAGFELPVQYSGVIAEHNAVRNGVGLFDVSHMGEFLVEGARAEEVINSFVTNDICGMYDGRARYSILPNEKGGAVDDIIVHRENAEKYWIVVNAANIDKDFAWIKAHIDTAAVKFENVSDKVAQIAVQGPKSIGIIEKLVADIKDIPQKNYTFTPSVKTVGDFDCYLAHTGYTGEDGYEIYVEAKYAEKLYDLLMELGAEYGVTPCGLGARDTLRLEAAMPLYGHELSDDYAVNEVGLDFAIKLDKENFVGKAAIQEHTPSYVRLGAKVEKGIAREHCAVFSGDEEVGIVTSGTFSPTLGYAIAMLRVKKEYANSPLCADVRGRRLNLELTPLPFYKRKK